MLLSDTEVEVMLFVMLEKLLKIMFNNIFLPMQSYKKITIPLISFLARYLSEKYN